MSYRPILKLENFSKSFFLHEQNKTIPSSKNVNLEVHAGQLTALIGRTGSGKSSVLKGIYRSYRPTQGRILYQSQHHGQLDLAQADDHQILALRKQEIGFVTQFLHVLPRQSTEEIVATPLYQQGMDKTAALEMARDMLVRLNLPQRLWNISPATFSGGEKQRVNLARGLLARPRLLLLDEPTASLDQKTSQLIVELIQNLKADNIAILAIFHDLNIVEQLSDRSVNLSPVATTL